MVFAIAFAAADARADEINASEVLTRAKAALAKAGAVEAELLVEVTYPTKYKSEIELIANQTGDERARIKTTINDEIYDTLEVKSGGVLWTQQPTSTGTLVTKIDLAAVKRALEKNNISAAAASILDVNALFDLDNLTQLVDFDKAERASGESTDIVLTGALKKAFAEDKAALPIGARRYFEKATIVVDAESFLPRRVELGALAVVVVTFRGIETNAEIEEGAFEYTPPEGAEVVDRTDWAVAQLMGE